MPPILHPRSRSTSSLFAATLLASFVIVGIPHIFPCPAPRRTLADSETVVTADGQIVQRPRRRPREAIEVAEDGQPPQPGNGKTLASQEEEEVSTFLQMEAEAKEMAKLGRQCPVPKPRGLIGEWLGFTSRDQQTTNSKESGRSVPSGENREGNG
ncbi:hypothetical protein VTN31DRAFT_4459 [Thermomyces dupontii]|uniref:uncharacterized protein n=1 Tax=Talaromyces thermophilus TaxID=28565 RepID=UPI003742E423